MLNNNYGKTKKILALLLLIAFATSGLFAADVRTMYQKAEDMILKSSNPTKAINLYNEFWKERDAYFNAADKKAEELMWKAWNASDSREQETYYSQYHELETEVNGVADSIETISENALNRFLDIALTTSDKVLSERIYNWLYDNNLYKPILRLYMNDLPNQYLTYKELSCRPGESVKLPEEKSRNKDFILIGYGRTKDKVDFKPGTSIELPGEYSELYAIWKNVYSFYDPVSKETTTIEAFPGEEFALPKVTSTNIFRFKGWEEDLGSSWVGKSIPATQTMMISSDRKGYSGDSFTYIAKYENASLVSYGLTDLGENANNIVTAGEDVGILPIYHNYGNADITTESTVSLSSESEYVNIKVNKLKISQIKSEEEYFAFPGGRQNIAFYGQDYSSAIDKILKNINEKGFKIRKNTFFIVEFSNETIGDVKFDIELENNGYSWKDSFVLSFGK